MADDTPEEYEVDDIDTLADIEDWEQATDDFISMLVLLSEPYEAQESVTDSVERVFNGDATEEDLERINDAMMSFADSYFEESE